VLVYNPYDPETVHNPYPTYARLRDEAPVYRNEELGFYALTRFEDVMEAHLDHETFSSAGGVTLDGSTKDMPLLIVKDPPEHTVHRRIVSPLFTPRRIADMEPFVRQTCADLLDGLAGREEIDLVQEFSIKFPLHVISELLDIPHDKRDRIHELSEHVAAALGDPDKEETRSFAGLELVELLMGLARERRESPGTDVISTLMTTPVDDGHGGTRLPDDGEIGIRFMELAFAGHETVAKLIPNGLIALTWTPRDRERLAADPSLIPTAVEEMLRWDPPTHYQGRTTTKDVTLHGVTIPAGSTVILVTAAALHDEREFPDPDAFDLDRVLDRHVGFGLGRHVCLGASLARLEVRIAFEELFKRYAGWELVEGGAVRGVQGNIRGLSNLRIAVTPHAALVG